MVKVILLGNYIILLVYYVYGHYWYCHYCHVILTRIIVIIIGIIIYIYIILIISYNHYHYSWKFKTRFVGNQTAGQKTVPWVLPKRWKTSGFSEGAQGSLHKHEYIIYSLLQGFGNPQPTPRKIQETEICSKEKLCGDT